MAQEIKSNVEGEVKEVNVKDGEGVSAGTTVVVVQQVGKAEASINTPVAGKIDSVKVKVGDKVTKDQVVAVVSSWALILCICAMRVLVS